MTSRFQLPKLKSLHPLLGYAVIFCPLLLIHSISLNFFSLYGPIYVLNYCEDLLAALPNRNISCTWEILKKRWKSHSSGPKVRNTSLDEMSGIRKNGNSRCLSLSQSLSPSLSLILFLSVCLCLSFCLSLPLSPCLYLPLSPYPSLTLCLFLALCLSSTSLSFSLCLSPSLPSHSISLSLSPSSSVSLSLDFSLSVSLSVYLFVSLPLSVSLNVSVSPSLSVCLPPPPLSLSLSLSLSLRLSLADLYQTPDVEAPNPSSLFTRPTSGPIFSFYSSPTSAALILVFYFCRRSIQLRCFLFQPHNPMAFSFPILPFLPILVRLELATPPPPPLRLSPPLPIYT